MSTNNCYHCGADCKSDAINFNQHNFCCNGCKTVYEILHSNELDCYYDLETTPGTIPQEISGKYTYLENEEIVDKLLSFSDGTTSVVELYVPVIHCSSCIWVLENLSKLNPGISNSMVNFPKKTLRVTFKSKEVSLKIIVELLSSIGYEPYISLEDSESPKFKSNNTLLYQLSVAAFCFGNVMLLSFPEYFDVEEFWLEKYKHLFRWIMFVMSVPVVFFSAKNYFTSAVKGLKHRLLNIDVPIALGIAVLFIRSSVEIILDIGSGFFDSLTGLVFFLLIGKFFQQKTYNFLSFERDYKSYFPIAVTVIENGLEKSIAVNELKKGDRLLIRNEELIPVDGILITGNAAIDYSFVTGESLPVVKESGDNLFAGGKQTSGAIEMEVVKSMEKSYLTQLWSNDVFKEEEGYSIKNLTDSISKYFTFAVLTIAIIAGVFWSFIDIGKAVNVVTAVLIIACPCALALSAPFALGNMLRIFGYKKCYLKNADSLENLARIDHIVFDKTGTLTRNDTTGLHYSGKELSELEKSAMKAVLRASNHPLSRSLYDNLDVTACDEELKSFNEVIGKGIDAEIGHFKIKLGSKSFVTASFDPTANTAIYIEINSELKGYYAFKNIYRSGLKDVFSWLSERYKLSILSGDNEGERSYLESIMPEGVELKFNKRPEDKLRYIEKLQENSANVLMIGDGLNDAGALAQSQVGLAVSDNVNVFSPACDAIMDAKLFNKLPKFLTLSKKSLNIIKASFILSFSYNLVGMYFALSGNLTPIVAAILMPLSSITIVVFVTICTNWVARKF